MFTYAISGIKLQEAFLRGRMFQHHGQVFIVSTHIMSVTKFISETGVNFPEECTAGRLLLEHYFSSSLGKIYYFKKKLCFIQDRRIAKLQFKMVCQELHS